MLARTLLWATIVLVSFWQFSIDYHETRLNYILSFNAFQKFFSTYCFLNLYRQASDWYYSTFSITSPQGKIRSRAGRLRAKQEISEEPTKCDQLILLLIIIFSQQSLAYHMFWGRGYQISKMRNISICYWSVRKCEGITIRNNFFAMNSNSLWVVVVFSILVKVISVASIVLAIQYFEIRENQLVHNVKRN